MEFSIQNLKDMAIWVTANILDDGKKLPMNPNTGKAAKSDDPSTWAPYDVAAEYGNRHSQPIGFVLPPDDMLPDGYNIVFVDIDGHNEGGPTRAGMKVYDKLLGHTYGEQSVSGSGYHFYGLIQTAAVMAALDGKPYKEVFYLRQNKLDVEIHISGFTNRYAIFTGKKLRLVEGPLQDVTEIIISLLNQYFLRVPNTVQQPATAPRTAPERTQREHGNTNTPQQKKPAERTQAPSRWLDEALANARFKSFYIDGKAPSDCGNDESAIDMAFLYLLAKYTHCDRDMMKEAFLKSAWMKSKDEAHIRKATQRADYLDRSISAAISYRNQIDVASSGVTKKVPFTREAFAAWLLDNNFHFRYNLIKHSPELPDGLMDKTLPPEIQEGYFMDELYSRLLGKYSYLTTKSILANVVLLSGLDSYNPVLERLAAAPEWDGIDRISQLYDVMRLQADDTLSRVLIRKWLLQAIAIQQNELSHPVQLDGILVLHGSQGIGKTTLSRKLAWNDLTLFKEGQQIRFSDKDTLIQSTAYFICELGEIARTTKADADSLKAFITSQSDEYRAPYTPTAKKFPRRTSFLGTVNDPRYLCDVTGNRRFWTVLCPSRFDLDGIAALDVTQLWKQVQREYQTAQDPRSCYILTAEEKELLEQRNNAAVRMSGLDEVIDILEDAKNNPDGYEVKPITVTAWKAYFPASVKGYTTPQISQCLKNLGYTPQSVRLNGKPTHSYILPVPKEWNSYHK